MRPLVGGVGSILTLHHVRPPRPDAFQPNRLLEVTPVFLERLLKRLKRSRADVISLDEMHRRFITGDFKRRFVCLTFDDGYKDLMRWAYPLLRKYQMPFAAYIATSFPDRLGELWWLALEAVIAQNTRVGLLIDGKQQFFECRNVREKRELYDAIYGYLRSLKTEDELRTVVRDLCATYSVEIASFCRELCMDWQEIIDLAADPLVTIGAHTVNHKMLKKVPDESAVARRNGDEPGGAGSRARQASQPFVLSGRRRHLGRPARIPHCGRARLQDSGDDTAGRAVQGAPRSLDRAAAYFGQRRVPAAALPEGADVGRSHGDVERLPPRQRGLISSGRAIHLMSSIAGTTQPSPATT